MNIQTNAQTRPTLHMQRVFDAPRELLWAAWTRPEMLVLWLGPAEWPAVSATQDLRVGGGGARASSGRMETSSFGRAAFIAR